DTADVPAEGQAHQRSADETAHPLALLIVTDIACHVILEKTKRRQHIRRGGGSSLSKFAQMFDRPGPKVRAWSSTGRLRAVRRMVVDHRKAIGERQMKPL